MDFLFNYVAHYGANFCVAHIPDSPFGALTSALVCGKSLDVGRDRQLFVDTGLLHLLVVSGLQLHALERLMRRLPMRIRDVLLVVYGFLTGFGLPVLRSLLRRLCARRTRAYGWTAVQTEALVTLLLLLAHPSWLLSRSFLLNWMCALALRAPLRVPRWRPLRVSLQIYIFLIPFVGVHGWLAVGWNALLAPLVMQGLFPVCLLSMLWPPLSSVADFCWRLVLEILAQGPHLDSVPESAWSPGWMWWFPWLTHSLLWIGEWKWRRASAFLS